MTASDQRAFRDALGHFPTGVTVVTAHAEGRDPVAMTVSSFNSVSLDPPLVLFSIGRRSPGLPALLAAESFGISVLDETQQDLSHRFAGAGQEKWQGFAPSPGASGCPTIGACLATFECTPFAVHEGGDHLIIVGRVERFEAAPERAPLVFFRGRYPSLAGA